MVKITQRRYWIKLSNADWHLFADVCSTHQSPAPVVQATLTRLIDDVHTQVPPAGRGLVEMELDPGQLLYGSTALVKAPTTPATDRLRRDLIEQIKRIEAGQRS